MGQLSFRPDIQGLRAIAVLLVLAYHGGLGVPGGFVGVDVFFVLSGFLITLQLLPDEQGRVVSWKEFYARRARRIVPLASLVIVTTLVACAVLLPPASLSRIGAAAAAASAFAANMWFAAQSMAYQGAIPADSPFLQFWSLAVEEQFYLLWPLLVVTLMSRGRPRRAMVALAALAACSLALCVALSADPSTQPWAMFSMPTRLWQLAAGGLLALAWSGRKDVRRPLATTGAIVGLGLLAAAALAAQASYYPGAWAAAPVAGTALLLWCAPGTAVAHALSWRPLVAVGAISYGLYLWHWPVLALAARWSGGPLTTWSALGALALSGALAAAGYALVERPVRYWPALVRSPSRSLAAAGALVAVALCASLLMAWRYAPVSAAALADRQGASLGAQPAGPERDKDAEEKTRMPECTSTRQGSATVPCDLVAGTQGRILVLGDSHARQWVPALAALAHESGAALQGMFKESCSPASVLFLDGQRQVPYVECEQWRESALSAVAADPPDVVVVAGYPHYSLSGDNERRDEMVLQGTFETLRRLQQAGSEVILMGEIPPIPEGLGECSQLGYEEAPACTVSLEGDGWGAINRGLAFAAEQAGAEFFPVVPRACPSGTCGLSADGTVVYGDSEHLSVPFVMSLEPELSRLVASLMPQ